MKTYLAVDEYGKYGLEAGTPESVVALATGLVDAHCRRPSLLLTEYTERVRFRGRATSARLSTQPVASVVQAKVRMGNAREGDCFAQDVAHAFGLPGSWTELNPASVQVRGETGEVEFGANVLGLAFNEADVTYSAGFAEAPEAVKLACAQIVRNVQATPALNVRGTRVDSLQMEYFAESLLDESVRSLLAPFVSQRLNA